MGSVEDIGTGTSQASHRQGRVQRLLTGMNCDSLLLHFPLLLPLTMVVTSLSESRESLHCAVIDQKRDHPNLATQSCFPLRKPRSRSKAKKQKKNSGAEERSRS